MPQQDLFDPDVVAFPRGSLISGRLTAGDGAEFAIIRPSDGKHVSSERGAGAALVDYAVAEARRAHAGGAWANATPQNRAQVFRRWAKLVLQHQEELVGLECSISTRLATEVSARDLPLTIAIIRYYGELIDKIEGQVLASPADVFNLTIREPYGVVGAISPWNVPMVLAVIKLAPALAAGNAVVLKPSELTPYSIVRIAQLAIEAGVPAGQIAILTGTGDVAGHALCTHPDVDYISFTGSTATGAKVMADAASAGPKPVSLELGGKSPQLVFADADLDNVAQIIAGSATRNGGQICYAGTRLVVEARIADTMVDKIARLMACALPGPTWSSHTGMSPIISRQQLRRVENILERGTVQGAEVVLGGTINEGGGGGFFFRPTIVRGVAPENPIVREEIFGPVLAVQVFNELEEGLALADHPDYGLAAGLHTRDVGKILKCSRALQAGTVWVNQYGPSDVVSPVGGYKHSGFGKDFGVDGLIKYLKTKNILMKAT